MNGCREAVPFANSTKLLNSKNDEPEFNLNADFTNKKGLVNLTKPASKPLLKYRDHLTLVL